MSIVVVRQMVVSTYLCFALAQAPDEEFEDYLSQLMGNNYTGDRNEVSGLQALNFLNVYWLAIICTYSSKLQSLQVNSLSISFSDGIVARRYY